MSTIENLNFHYTNAEKFSEPLNKFFLILYYVFSENYMPNKIEKLNDSKELENFFIEKKLIESPIHYEAAFGLWKEMYPSLREELIKLDPNPNYGEETLNMFIDMATRIFNDGNDELTRVAKIVANHDKLIISFYK
jgi:hypothetical protein